MSGIVGSRLTDAADVRFVLGLFVIGVAIVMTNVRIGLARSTNLE